MTIEIINRDNKIEILIENTPHLSLKRSEIIGFQSWITGEEHRTYFIEYYLKTKDILTEYDSKEKWEKILILLKKENLFQDNF